MDDRTQLWNDFAAQLAVDSIRCTTAAGSGHPTSSMSAAHLIAVLYADHLRTNVAEPADLANDRFVLSKGHAAPVLYAALKAIGAISDEEMLTLRRFGSPIQGHPAPVPELPWVDVATGSLGQGLPIGVGMAFALRLDGSPGHVWVMMGDSEMAEGSIWEAMETASFHGLNGLTAILDLNKLGQRGPTMHGWHADVFRDRAEAFGWGAIEIDGHDVAEIDAAYTQARNADRPTMIVARTEKGHGVSLLANAEGWHGKALSDDQAAAAIDELGGVRNLTITPPKPESFIPVEAGAATAAEAPVYEGPIATRKAFGDALAWLATRRPELVVIDGEVGNSTYTDDVLAVAPDRFLEVYIAEQTMVGAQIGMQALGKVAFSATFGAFYTRATDFVRMGAIGRADLRLCGSHAGVSIGEDGPVADGARGPGDDARAAQLDRAVSGRRERDRETRGRHVRRAGHLVHPDHARGDAVAVRRGRAVPDRGQQDAGVEPGRSRDPGRRRRHAPRVHGRRGDPREGGRHGAGDRLLFREADRRADVAEGARGDRHRSSWSRTTGSKAASATRCWMRWRRPVRSPAGS